MKNSISTILILALLFFLLILGVDKIQKDREIEKHEIAVNSFNVIATILMK
jgi:hypothetical protein